MTTPYIFSYFILPRVPSLLSTEVKVYIEDGIKRARVYATLDNISGYRTTILEKVEKSALRVQIEQ